MRQRDGERERKHGDGRYLTEKEKGNCRNEKGREMDIKMEIHIKILEMGRKSEKRPNPHF